MSPQDHSSTAALARGGSSTLRPFGTECADLDLVFERPDRFAVAAAVIAACSAPRGQRAVIEQALLELPVGSRISRLLRLVETTEASDTLVVMMHCPGEKCRQAFEVRLPFEQLQDSGPDKRGAVAGSLDVELPRGTSVRVRPPTGFDQREWRSQHFLKPEDAFAHMVRTLTGDASRAPEFGDDDLRAISGALEEMDPLVAFKVVTSCPHCDVHVTSEVDLEAESLRRLHRTQRALFRDVHILASHYGWSEAEVSAIPPARRAHYIQQIEATKGGAP